MTTTFARQYQRRRTSAQWTAENPILGPAEIAVITGGAVIGIKIGDGVTPYVDLPGPMWIEDLPELASSDPSKMSISTAAGVTTLGVDKLAADYARLTANSSPVSNSQTPVDVTGLSLPVAANAVYWVDSYIFYNTTTVADIRLSWTAPAGVDGRWFTVGLATGASSDTFQVTFRDRAWNEIQPFGGAGATDLGCTLRGLLRVGATAGTLQLQFCQNALEVSNTVVLSDSVLRLEQVS